MTDYSPQIVEHFSNPRNIGEMEDPDLKVFIGNPVCGDQIHLFVRLEEDRIGECTFLAYGCAASLATASILTEAIRGQRVEDLEPLNEEKIVEMVGGLTPSQRHCATLAQDLVRALLHDYRTGTTGGVEARQKLLQNLGSYG